MHGDFNVMDSLDGKKKDDEMEVMDIFEREKFTAALWASTDEALRIFLFL